MKARYAKGNNAKRIRKWEPPQHSYLLKKGTERKMNDEKKELFKYIANVYDKDSYLKIEFGFNLFEELSDFAETCIDHGKCVEIYKSNND